jgi:purine-cytosine permease-like protein
MQNRSGTIGEEVADQVGIFLSVVTGFIVAQAWNTAILTRVSRHKSKDNAEWYVWMYATVTTLVALSLMVIWGYFVASRLYRPSVELKQLRTQAQAQAQAHLPNK